MLVDDIETRGEKFFPNNHTPFLINCTTDIWWIKKGAVDVFAFPADNKEILDPRLAVCRFSAGQIIFGFNVKPENRMIDLLVVGVPNTEIIHIKREKFSSLLQERDLPDLVHWIAVWQKQFSIYNWVNLKDKVEITKENVNQPVNNWQIILDKFNANLMQLITNAVLQKNVVELKHLRYRSSIEHSNFKKALQYLANIVAIKKKKISIGESSHALLNVCQWIAKSLGVPFQLKPHILHAADNYRLEDIAKDANLLTRQVSLLTREWWKKDNGPLLAFDKTNHHPVALLPINSHQYEMVDPRKDSRVLVTAEVANTLADNAFMFFRALPTKLITLRELIRFSLVGSLKDILRLLLMGTLGGVASVTIPYSIGLLFGEIIPGNETTQLIQVILLLLVISGGIAVFEMVRSIALLRIEGRINIGTQAAVVERLFNLPAAFFRQFNSGDLAQRVLATDSILQLLTGATQTAILSGIFSIFSGIYMFFLNVSLALLATGLIIIAVIVFVALNYWRLTYERRYSKLQGKVINRIFQLLNGIKKIRIAGAETKAFSLWAKEFGNKTIASVKAQKISNYLLVFNAIFLVTTSLIIFGFVGIAQLNISVGNFLAFNAAYVQFALGILGMSVALTSTLNAIPLYERARPILKTLPEVDSTKISPGELRGDIEINQVAFRYSAESRLILSNLSMKINAGEFIAIVGPSSSGKTTLFRLLLGLETPAAGAIYYDGKNINDFDIQALRRQLGVVIQNAKLIPGDIFLNIVGSSQASLEDAWHAAELAGFDNDIKAMPMGMQTLISEESTTVSGGQRQRLLIARAIVHKPKIILFDEASSALDNLTQLIVSDSLKALNATRILIAHRLSTIMAADRIYVIDEGKVVEYGNYAELMKMNGKFAELSKRQLIK